jgi:hypothetical protein
MKLWIPWNVWNFLTSWTAVTFSRGTLFHAGLVVSCFIPFPSCSFETFLRSKLFQVVRHIVRRYETVRQCSCAVRVLLECIVCYCTCVSLSVMFVYCKTLWNCCKSSHILHISQHIIVFSLCFIYIGHSERCSRLKLYEFFMFILWLCSVIFAFPWKWCMIKKNVQTRNKIRIY